jgi:sugar lactone lactonase YvrE
VHTWAVRLGRCRSAALSLGSVLMLGICLTPTAHASASEPPQFSLQWGTMGTDPGQFTNPAALALDADGNLYVADSGLDRIQVFDAAGGFLRQWGQTGTRDGEFDEIYGVAVDDSGNVYATDYQNTRVEKFGSDGTFVKAWGTPGNAAGQLYKPEAITTDSAGNVYVADTGNFRVQKFDPDGNHLLTIGSRGTAPGQLRHPEGVAVDPSGNIYVADPGNFRVQKFDSAGNLLTMWGTQGTGPGQFGRPDEGLVLDDLGNVYVTDTSNDRVQKFDADGNFLAMWGSTGTGSGQFDFPYGIAVNAGGDVYVSDFLNHRIERFAQVRRPDALLRRAGAGVPFVGDGIYNDTGAGQSRTRKVAAGTRSTFLVQVQNDGSYLDGSKLQGGAGDADFAVRYFSGTTNVTTAVVNGTYETSVLPPDSAETIKVVITAKATAAVDAKIRCAITASSSAGPAQKDVVAATVTVV